jgi:hypothetical protein
MIALAVLLSFAELVSWWTVIILPVMVAVLVKINDSIKSLYGRSELGRRLSRARGVARVRDARWEAPTMVLRVVALPQSRRRAG